MSKQFTIAVLERFMTAQEISDLKSKYEANKKVRAFSRNISLAQPLTDEELNLIKDWIANVPVNEIRTKYNVKISTLYGKLGRIALRALSQKKSL